MAFRRCLGRRHGERCALVKRVLQVDRDAVLLEQIGERFVGQFLNRRHPVAPKLLQLVEGVVVEGDQLAHASSAPAPTSLPRPKADRIGIVPWVGTGSLRSNTGSGIKAKIALRGLRLKQTLLRTSSMMDAIPNAGPGAMPGGGSIRKTAVNFARRVDDLGVAEKIYSIVALLVILTTFLVVMSIQSVRLQTAYRHLLASSASAAINIERVNGLIYAIVMESRGIYMSTERTKVKQFGDELLKRNRELAEVVAGWEETVRFDDAAQFSAFKQRIMQFIEFRKELVRRAMQISPAAGREWGDNDANRALRSQLNADLEAFARIYADRAGDVAELDDKSRYASWYLFALGLGALMLAALNVFVMRRYVTGKDEIGHLARAVRNFRDAACRNLELEQLEIGTAKQRDTAMGERDKLTDKYHATKWQLSAAINSMPQGMIMLDAAAKVLAVNDQYRKIYGLPPTIKTGSSLQEILQHRAENGLFAGNVARDLVAVVARIAKRQPSTDEIF